MTPRIAPSPPTADAGTAQAARKLHADNSGGCHGRGATIANAIRDLEAEKRGQCAAIVRRARLQRGMPSFGGCLETDDIEKIRAFPIRRAHDLKGELAGAPPATEEKTK